MVNIMMIIITIVTTQTRGGRGAGAGGGGQRGRRCRDQGWVVDVLLNRKGRALSTSNVM